MTKFIRATYDGKCDNCQKPFREGSKLKSVCFAAGSSGFVAQCCFALFPVFFQFKEEGWEESGVWKEEEF